MTNWANCLKTCLLGMIVSLASCEEDHNSIPPSSLLNCGSIVDDEPIVIGSPELSVALDASSPGYQVAVFGDRDVTLCVLKIHAASEGVDLRRLSLKMSGRACNAPSDLTKVTIWTGATKVGEVVFFSDNATATLTGVTVPKDGDVLLAVKGDFAGSGLEGTLIKVDHDGSASVPTYGVGAVSGAVLTVGGGDTQSLGVRLFSGYPVFERLELGDTSVLSGSTTRELARWSVTAIGSSGVRIISQIIEVLAGAQPVGSSEVLVEDLKIVAATDSGFVVPYGGSPDGRVAEVFYEGSLGNDLHFVFRNGSGDQWVDVSAGQTIYFRILAEVSLTGAPTSAFVSTHLLGDSRYPYTFGLTDTSFYVEDAGAYNLIWAPRSDAAGPDPQDPAWTNSYGLPGLPLEGPDPWFLVR